MKQSLRNVIMLMALATTQQAFAQELASSQGQINDNNAVNAQASALAQKAEKVSQMALGLLTTSACQSTFTSGSGVSYMEFCITQNGNVSQFESPSGSYHLYQGGEGYGVCDVTNNANLGYHDWGVWGGSGWQDAILTQPNGPNTFPLTITRTSVDGVWTLTQVFSRNTTTPAIKITMTLKNNSAVSRKVLLTRFADIDADGYPSGSQVFLDADLLGAWGHWLHGLQMRVTSNTGLSAGRIVLPGASGPCNMAPQKTPFTGDGAAVYLWVFTVGAHTSTTQTVEYRAF